MSNDPDLIDRPCPYCEDGVVVCSEDYEHNCKACNGTGVR